MKFWTKLLVPVLALSLIGVADAAGGKGAKGAKKAKHEGVAGKVVSVSSDGIITITHGGKKAGATKVEVKTDDKTAVTIDGTAGKVSDLKPGEKVVVTPTTGTATEIKATKAKGKGAKAPKAGKKGKKAAQ